MSFEPKTGAVIDRISRSEPLSEKEEEFAAWAEKCGLFVVFGKQFPLEDDEEQYEPFLTWELGIEEFVDEKIVATFTTLSRPLVEATDQQWAMLAVNLRYSHLRTKREMAA